jgi:hypothetical protein
LRRDVAALQLRDQLTAAKSGRLTDDEAMALVERRSGPREAADPLGPRL